MRRSLQETAFKYLYHIIWSISLNPTFMIFVHPDNLQNSFCIRFFFTDFFKMLLIAGAVPCSWLQMNYFQFPSTWAIGARGGMLIFGFNTFLITHKQITRVLNIFSRFLYHALINYLQRACFDLRIETRIFESDFRVASTAPADTRKFSVIMSL